jgi:uncharacterized membrane protein YvbJ
MNYCPDCGARLAAGADECFQCHARLNEAAPSAADVRRQARRGALQGALIAGAIIVALIIAVSALVEFAVR